MPRCTLQKNSIGRLSAHKCCMLLTLMMTVLSGCGGGGGNDSHDNAAEKYGEYVVVTDPTEQAQLRSALYSILTAPVCWDSTFVTATTPSGYYVGSVLQYSFYGSWQYRYYGFEPQFGSIQGGSIGKRGDLLAAVLPNLYPHDVVGMTVVANDTLLLEWADSDGRSGSLYYGARFQDAQNSAVGCL